MTRRDFYRAAGRRVMKLRLARDVSPAALAQKLGVSPQRLSNIEAGLRPLDPEVATQICALLDTSLDHLYRGSRA